MDPQRVRAQLGRILASATFSDAERGSRFLRFVVEAAVEGRASEVKESVMGVKVLGRSPSFDPKTDPLVRVEAGRLRGRLSAYYQGTYSLKPDCAGSMVLTVSAGPETFTNHVDLVVVHGGTQFRAINTDSGSVIATVGKKQFPEQ